MSCKPGQPCEEGLKRRRAVTVLGVMAAIFLALSAVSFLESRGQAIPSRVAYGEHGAVDGKRVFQAYNCMGCHTIVGNGAYFAPDLTRLYDAVGPAWLEAFIPSAGSWPTQGAVRLQLQNPAVAAEAGVDDIAAYLAKYPGAAERIARRGGQRSLMPNLPISRGETGRLIAFFKYTSSMNTEGWPPTPKVDGLSFPHAVPMPVTAAAAATPPATETAATPAAQPVADPVAEGASLVEDYGCTACHATTAEVLSGPGWGGLYGHPVPLADGSTVTADDAYLARSITDPDAQVVKGFEPEVMPAFEDEFDDDQLAAIVAYIRSLGGTR